MPYSFPRSAGVLLPISALPSDFGVGDLGPHAHRFIDRLKGASQSYWQVLPFNYSAGKEGCPYACYSTFGYYPHLISLDLLHQQGLLLETDLSWARERFDFENEQKTDYVKVAEVKFPLFKKAWQSFRDNPGKELGDAWTNFVPENAHWTEDFALFLTLTVEYGKDWTLWPAGLRDRLPEDIGAYLKERNEEVTFHLFLQFLFRQQWSQLRTYAHKNGIKIVGDLPIFVAHHSLDVWMQPDQFKLNSKGLMDVETGAPPDGFNKNGQKWSTPNYNWDKMADEGFTWWKRRIGFLLDHFDIVRLDHFIGLEHVWEVPVEHKTARKGSWVPSRGRDLLKQLVEDSPDLPIIAEDLGKLTDEVIQLRDDFQLPSMRIMQFAFGSGSCNEHLPDNIPENAVVYTGTHDNNTLLGWWDDLEKYKQKDEIQFVKETLKISGREELVWPMIRFAHSTKAHTAIIPLQDILQLDGQARFNVPGTIDGNWQWRFRWDQVPAKYLDRLKAITVDSHRGVAT